MNATVISTLQGIYSTKYRLLVSVPIAVSTAIASSMIPSLVASVTTGDRRAIKDKVTMAVKFNMIIAFPSAVGLAILAQPIIRLLFPASDYVTGGMMLMTGSTCIIFYALSTVTSGVLQSIDRMNLPVIHSLISLAIHVVVVFTLLRFTGMGAYALVFGNVTYPLVVCFLNGRSVSRNLGFKQVLKKSDTLEEYSQKVEKIKQYIKDGHIFQTVLSQRWTIETKQTGFELYEKLRELNPSPYLYYYNFGDFEIIGSSPEMIVKQTDSKVYTCPIAGTRRRGKTKEEDIALEEELLAKSQQG